MLNQVLAALLPVIGWGLLTLIINLAFGYKSQIEAWAESNPRAAGLLKLSRALGLDPWNGLAALKLIAKKKLPDAQKSDSPVAQVEQRKAYDKLRAAALDDDTVHFGPPPGPLLVLLLLGFAVHQQGCARMADPCSEVTLATIQAGCEARIDQECNGEKSCPAYVECSKAVKTWRACSP